MITLQTAPEIKQQWTNIGSMLQRNAARYPQRPVFRYKEAESNYITVLWSTFYNDILNIGCNLQQLGFKKGQRLVIFSRNSLEMLQLELAVMSMGGIAIPVFAHFKKPTSDLLIQFAETNWLALEGNSQLMQVSEEIYPQHRIILSKTAANDNFPGAILFADLKIQRPSDFNPDWEGVETSGICLGMYTSGTMDKPKLVQLTHRNILSQQTAIKGLLKIDEHDRFLSYLPWHHSFGGIFELFASLANGACYALESSYGKDVDEIFENWKQIKPTVFFSVPRIYQSLFEMTRHSAEAENIFFNSGLKFVFTAAAALPTWLSAEFEKRKIPVIEGWGLTETSPCCTLTDPELKRSPAVVGMPIPGVTLRLEDDGEILVKGPNVMAGYFNNDTANAAVFTEDGWFKTGDIGELTETGLKLISRKDRIFKLSNGEKVIPTELETAIQKHCHYVQHVLVTGAGTDYPVALIFPNKNLIEKPSYLRSPEEGCFCPRNLEELSRCLRGCLKNANNDIHQKFSRLKSAALIWDELSIDNATLTPSLKMMPKNVLIKYRNHLNKLYGDEVPVEEEIYLIEL